MLIDWMTLRLPFSALLGQELTDRLQAAIGRVVCIAPDGLKKWEKLALDLDALRSDTPGLCWTIIADGEGQRYLTIGASPASLQHGNNVFGSADPRQCAEILIRFAGLSLGAILPGPEAWQCRRIDVTTNHALGSGKEVKQALRLLLGADASRSKASSKKGNSVYWNADSDLRSGKAYHKGPQLHYLAKRDKVSGLEGWQYEAADRIIRFELKLGSRWFRRLEDGQHADLPRRWLDLTPQQFFAEHHDYFGRFIGSMEVTDMGQLLNQLEKVAPTPGQALAAHRTWALIKSVGYDNAKESMPERTWYRHIRFLRAAGLSDADLCAGNVIPFRQREIVLSQPLRGWDDLREAA